jgi:hypothetical protein
MNSYQLKFSVFSHSVLGLLLVLLISSCASEKSRHQEEYLIKVDSFVVADTVKLKEAFEITFYGIIGENGCYRFSRFLTEQSDSLCKIQVIGSHPVGDNLVCPEILPLLNGTKLSLQAHRIGDFGIEITNPGLNQMLRKTIVVLP